ncbi:hypothetical protein [Salinispora arenicola]|uniref:hypothetical protein n=1 Tax=Salinispora arenicola TaxID=168697 RepID=UPI000374A4DC|nr:hypothetical protein [Salinispora arenicola]
MKQLHTPTLLVNSPSRRAIYALLSNGEVRTWTVTQLASALPSVSVEAIRTTIYLLIGEQFVAPVPRTRNLTVQATDEGTHALREILATWNTPPSHS